jgi:hypothetical protein
MIDYGRLAWHKLIGRCKKTPDKSSNLRAQFWDQWCTTTRNRGCKQRLESNVME